MSVPVKHHTRGKVGRRRANLNLAKVTVISCISCKAPAMRHRICSQCGTMQVVKRERTVRPAAQPTATAPVAEATEVEEITDEISADSEPAADDAAEPSAEKSA